MDHDEFIATMKLMDEDVQSIRREAPEMVFLLSSIVRTYKDVLDIMVVPEIINKEEHKELTEMVMRWMDPLPPKSVWRKMLDAVRYGHL